MFTPPPSVSFLLRCWEEREEQPGQPGIWRFSLDDPKTGERRGFADLETLTAFLNAQLRTKTAVELKGMNLKASKKE